MKLFFILLLSLSNKNHKELQTSLLENYSATNIDSTVFLRLGIALRAINNVDQIEGTITSNVWLRYYWNDKHLTWNPENYNNISQTVFNTDPSLDQCIWTPDMYLYNTAEKPQENLDYTRAVVQNNGDVFWSRPGLITSLVHIRLTFISF